MSSISPDVFLVICLLLFFAYEFLRDPRFLRDKKYLVSGLVSTLFILVTLILFLFDAERRWIYITMILGIVPGLHFQYLKVKGMGDFRIVKIVPTIVAIILAVYILAIL